MQIRIYILLGYFLIFCSNYFVVNAKPLIGENVRNAYVQEFPFVVSLMHLRIFNANPVEDHICTGSLISSNYVITAEHCIVVAQPLTTAIYVGSTDLRNCEIFYIYWWISFEQWAVANNVPIEFDINDVAVVRLIRRIPEPLPALQLSNIMNYNLYGAEVTMVGWSPTNETAFSPHMKVANVTILTHDDCQHIISDLSQDEITFDVRQALCTIGNPYVLMTEGDSGGPLLLHNILIGINRGTCPHFIQNNHLVVNIHMPVRYFNNFFMSVLRL